LVRHGRPEGVDEEKRPSMAGAAGISLRRHLAGTIFSLILCLLQSVLICCSFLLALKRLFSLLMIFYSSASNTD
jgi:hypothetical protein